ncbi:MAG: stage V sporulation T C-terminal domain-containing protein [Bacillota bacterium]|nr:stage V sporulation T C-terminal domain-containing protein [Bacillota bacterium]
MKATGIVRRIDDLGRIVIPKEIRRTLRIREGDPLEIYVDHDGEVILKKYAPMGDLSDFAREYAESLHETTGLIALVTDRSLVLTVAGAPKREFVDRRIGTLLKHVLETGRPLTSEEAQELAGGITVDEDRPLFRSFTIMPIPGAKEAIGTVMLASRDDRRLGPMEEKLLQAAAGFLSRQMGS